jgi:uncharacterized HAD superfamily protein
VRIGLDADGVIYKFFKVYNQKLIDLGHEMDPEDLPETWDYFVPYGYTREDFLRHMEELVAEKKLFWAGELCEPEIPELIYQMKEAEHSIHIVTNRFVPGSEEATYHWFQENDVYYDTLTFTHDKTSVPTDVFLEDNRDNYDALVNADIPTWLVDRPYNQDTDGVTRDRVNSFKRFAEIIRISDPWAFYYRRKSWGIPDSYQRQYR